MISNTYHAIVRNKWTKENKKCTTQPIYDKARYRLYDCFQFITRSDDTSILTETLVQHFVTHWIWANEIYRTFYIPTMYSTCMTFQKKKIFSIENFPLWSIELNGADDVWAYWTTYAVCDCIARNGRKKLVCISLSIESLCLVLILDFRVRYG